MATKSAGIRMSEVDLVELAERSRLSLSAQPRPFVRWAGSKRPLLPHIVSVMPRQYGAYHEPFLGGGSLFFLLQPQRARLSDSCTELIATFEAVREDARAVVRHLRPWRPDPDFFYALRKSRSRGRYRRAAEFIYLNKTCWNGLYRVNSRGEFNVPYGLPKTDYILDEDNLIACGRALSHPGVSIRCCDFDRALDDVASGDLVFLDPPYVTTHNNNGFIDYNKQLFSWDDQVRLAARARELACRGAHVIVTNAHHADVLRLYEGFNVRPVSRSSTLAANPSKRSRVNEALLWFSPSRRNGG